YSASRRAHPVQPRRLRGPAAWLATSLAIAPVAIGFGAPASYLLAQTVHGLKINPVPSASLLRAGANTLTIALAATLMTVVVGLVVAWSAHPLRRPGGWRRAWPRLATLGYALPGTVLAIGLLFPLMLFERGLAAMRAALGL